MQTTTLVHRADYRQPAFWIRTVDLTFDLDAAETVVTSGMHFERNRSVAQGPLRLHGEGLQIRSVRLDGADAAFRLDGEDLVIDDAPDADFTLEICNSCWPERNTALSGLYTSGGSLFTQCEAEGFRRITWFLDRPDVMAVYTVTLRANRQTYPVLLSNGNLTDSGAIDADRHYAVWSDPFPKPSYLFALVAGDLAKQERHIRSRAGREHLLQMYVRAADLGKIDHAMNSLVAAIEWDEARFGLPLDLERFMVVAVSDFNSGAMENKGLNIFNTAALLASKETTTDPEFAQIESVVAHEYFHNWTGNRVTCRDWFQLSLKEGLTVFRHQEFAMDRAALPSARAVCRIQDVKLLRSLQFPEDSGAMAHPVRPDSYGEIGNFYTPTVYVKGAELVRMMQTLVDRAGFEQGMKLYFARYDGQAVTCDDFAQAIADANPASPLATRLDAFKRWYSQAGTPRVLARGVHDPAAKTYTLHLSQYTPPTFGQEAKLPLVIPVAMALLDPLGRALPLRLGSEAEGAGTERVLVLEEAEQSFVFHDIAEPPVPSLLRGFSAPVVIEDELADDALLTLMRHDSDAFKRWEVCQRLALGRIVRALQAGHPLHFDAAFIDTMRAVLEDTALDPAFKALALTLPDEGQIAEQLDIVNPQAIHAAMTAGHAQLAGGLREALAIAFDANQVGGPYAPDPAPCGQRALANLALSMLVLDGESSGDTHWSSRAYRCFQQAGNMTERFGALSALVNAHAGLAELALADFHETSKDDALVIDKWFAVQAVAPEVDGRVFARAKELLRHPDFCFSNPNRVRSLFGSLFMTNPAAFHRTDGAGYALWAEQVLVLDALNPHIASRLARSMDRWARLAEPYRSAARTAVADLAANAGLSGRVREIVERSLRSGD